MLFSRWIFAFAVLEAGFYVVVYRPRKKRLQKSIYKHIPLDREERQELFAKCAAELSKFDSSSKYPLGWFSSPNLKRENVVDWILWALFSCNPEDAQDSWNDEIGTYLKTIEERIGRKLEDGRAKMTTSLRLTLDPVKMSHRPLVWYLIVALVDLITSIRLYTLGFSHYSPSIFTRIFPPRFFTIFSKPSVTKNLSYWYRPHRSPNKEPIVFIHGIGIGLRPYVPFIQDLIKVDSDVGILLIEFLPICMHITADPIPPRSEMLDAIYAIIHSLGISHAVLASHSYGSVVAAYLIRDQRQRSPHIHTSARSMSPTKPEITAYLFIDPIPFLLHLPNIAFNFLYRYPRHANEWQLWYFASQDPDIAYTLGRCFFWAECILWKDDLDLDLDLTLVNSNVNAGPKNQQVKLSKQKFAVVLAGDDQIVPALDVWRYLTGEDQDPVKHVDEWSNVDQSLQVLYHSGLDHAVVFDTEERRRGMVRILNEFTFRSQ